MPSLLEEVRIKGRTAKAHPLVLQAAVVLEGGVAAMFGELRKPTHFCMICFRYMTPAQARAHSKHAKAIIIKKPKK